MIKTAEQIAHLTLKKIAEGEFVQALNRGANTLGFGPDSSMMDTAAAIGSASGPTTKALRTVGQNPVIKQTARGVLGEVPGVLKGYGAKLRGMFSRTPESTPVAEGGPKSFEAIKASRSAKEVKQGLREATPTAADATLAPPNRKPVQAPATDGSTDPTQAIFNPSNVPKSQGLLQSDARFAAKPPQDRTRVNYNRLYQDRAEAVANRATYDPPRGNVPEAAPSAGVSKAAPIALAGTTAAGVGAGLLSMSTRTPSQALTGSSVTPAMSVAPNAPNTYSPTALTTPAAPAAPATQATPTSRVDRGLLRNRAQFGSPDAAPTYNDRASRGLTLRGPTDR